MTSKVIQGHMRPILWQNHSSAFVYEPILIKICMDANIMKSYVYHVYDIEKFCDFFYFKTIWLNYHIDFRSWLMENFCPYFKVRFGLVSLINTYLIKIAISNLIWILNNFYFVYQKSLKPGFKTMSSIIDNQLIEFVHIGNAKRLQ